MFDKLVTDNQSIISAYEAMQTKRKEEVLTESEDSGGDPSAYNKYLLAKLGDLPRTKAGYEAGKMEEKEEEHEESKEGDLMGEGLLDKAKEVGSKVLKTLGHGSDEDLIKDLQKKAGVPETGKKPETVEEDADHSDEEEDKELIRDMVKPEALKEDATDIICMDVPFLIRVMEYAKEDAKSDEDLHVAAEKMIAASKSGHLTMAAYDEVFGKPHSGPDGDNDADDKEESEVTEDKEHLDEVLTASTPVETWIKDFIESDNPKFDGKSKEERRKMAIGAYYGAQKK